MLVVGEDPKKAINAYSTQFSHDFLQLLRTAHGSKSVQINHFYQEYIANKNHVHMNSTKWPSLTEYAKHLGRESICRVEETDKGLHIAWIDNSPEALKRQDAIRRKEMLDKGDEEREQRMIREQQKRAELAAEARRKGVDEGEESGGLKREEGEKIKLSFGAKPAAKESEVATPTPTPTEGRDSPKEGATESTTTPRILAGDADPAATPGDNKPTSKEPEAKPATFKFGAKPQVKNVFTQAKKTAFSSGPKKSFKIEQPKKMSEAERIMRDEMDKKRGRESSGPGGPNKKPRF